MPAYKKTARTTNKGPRNPIDPLYREYDPKFHPQNLIDLMSIGMLNSEIQKDWGISDGTFQNWRKKNPELEEAYQVGIPQFESWWLENRLKPLMDGRNESVHSFKTITWILENKTKFARPKVINPAINIEINSSSSSQQLLEKLKENLKFLEEKNIVDADFKVLIEHDKSNEQNS